MLKLAQILCGLLATGLLVVAQVGCSPDQTNDLILSRLDLARLSQLRVELRKLEPSRRCLVLEQELNAMFQGVLPVQGQAVFRALASILSQRKLPFQNSQPVLEDIQMCMGLAPQAQSPPVYREVIKSPPVVEPIKESPMKFAQDISNEFNAVKNRVKDAGQDLYSVKPVRDYPIDNRNHAMDVANHVINNNVNRIEDAIQDIVEDAADGRIDGIKGGHMPAHFDHYPHVDEQHYEDDAYLHGQHHEDELRMQNTVDRIEDAIEDVMEDAAHHQQDHSAYGHDHSYVNPNHIDHMQHQHGVDEAKRVIEGQMDHLEHQLKDIVEDAADGRIDGIKGHMPSYGADYHGPRTDVYSNIPQHGSSHGGYVHGGESHHGHDYSHGAGAHFGGAGPIDPRTLPTEREMQHAKHQVERRIDDLQDRLHHIVEDAADGRVDGRIHGHAGGYHHGHGGMAGKIRDELVDIVADDRIDGIKSRLGFPNSRHHYRSGYSRPHGGKGGSFSRLLDRGLDKLDHKLKEIEVPSGHLGGHVAAARYEFAGSLRELHELMAYNHQESPLTRCDRFSTLLGNSGASHDQVRHIATQPLVKLATGRPLAEARPVLQSMLYEYGNLFMSSRDEYSLALGDELLRCASMARNSHQHHSDPYYQASTGHLGGHGGVYPGVGHSGAGGLLRRGVDKFNSKLGMLPFEKQLNTRFPTMPAMPTMHY